MRFTRLAARFRPELTSAVGMILAWVVAAGWLSSAFQPVPISDWADYWYAASALGEYLRGGLSLLALAVPKALGFEAWQGALLVNSIAVLCLALACAHVDSSRYRLPTVLVWCYLFLLVPYAGIVQLDMMAAAALAAAIVAGRSFLHSASGRSAIVMVLALVFAASTRTHYSLVLLAFAVLLAPVASIKPRMIVLAQPYAWYWLASAPVAQEKLAAHPFFASRMQEVSKWYDRSFKTTRSLILLLVAVTVSLALRHRAFMKAAIPLAWLGAFWCVHVLLEIQSRYFLGMYLLAPLFCAALWLHQGPVQRSDDAAERHLARVPE